MQYRALTRKYDNYFDHLKCKITYYWITGVTGSQQETTRKSLNPKGRALKRDGRARRLQKIMSTNKTASTRATEKAIRDTPFAQSVWVNDRMMAATKDSRIEQKFCTTFSPFCATPFVGVRWCLSRSCSYTLGGVRANIDILGVVEVADSNGKFPKPRFSHGNG